MKAERKGVPSDVLMAGLLLDEPKLPNPFPPLQIPPYVEMRRGDWSLVKDARAFKVRGYFSPGYQQLADNWVLYARLDNRLVTWMSVTPMELESQAHHALAAKGDVLIGGLGMGVLAYNVAQKAEVKRILVVERDPHVAEIINEQATQGGWANWDKVEVLISDVFHTQLEQQFDVALFDIWPYVGDSNLRPDLQSLSKIIKAHEYAAWGLEMDFVTWLSQSDIPSHRVAPKHWREYSKALGVPLIMRNESMMSALAMQAVVQGMKHEADKVFGKVPR